MCKCTHMVVSFNHGRALTICIYMLCALLKVWGGGGDDVA